jgi:hypothetical protein
MVMPRTLSPTSAWSFALLALAPACVGGGGDLGGDFDGHHEGARGAFESPGSTREAAGMGGESSPTRTEGAGTSGERPPGGSGTLDCNGTYTCTVSTGIETEIGEIRLSERNGACTIEGQATLAPDGQIVVGGQVVGRWSGGGTSFFLTFSTNQMTGAASCQLRAGDSPNDG